MNYSERAVALASALEADGYHLAIEELDAKLSVVITAGPDACEDCLVPKDLMRGMLSSELGVDGSIIDITYPVDLPGYAGGTGH
jgi:molybdopterin/thiamine biosynthesis adenylyltransferase